MTDLVLSKSKIKGKKFTAKLYADDQLIKTFHFGSPYHENYILHKDPERKKRYIARHSKEDWTKINPGSLSRYLLWEKPYLEDAIEAFEKRFNVKIHIL